jgi:hypothetical protein
VEDSLAAVQGGAAMKRMTYCGKRLTAEFMAMLNMITADEYMRLTGDPFLLSAKQQARRAKINRAVTERNLARYAKKRRVQIVGANGV